MIHDQTDHSVYLHSVVSSGLDLKTSMNHLIDYCEKQHPAPVWQELRTLDYAADAEAMRNWLGALLTAEPPGDSVEAFWCGLQTWPRRGGTEDCVFYVAGSDYFDVRDPKWYQLPVYWPAGRKADSPVLQEMHDRLRQAGGRAPALGRYMLELGYCCLAAASAWAGIDLRLLLGGREQRHVAVGFDDGAYLIVGLADRHGWRRAVVHGEQLTAAAKPSLPPAGKAGARNGSGQGGAFSMLQRAAGVVRNVLAGVEAEPVPAPAGTAMGVEPAVPRARAFAAAASLPAPEPRLPEPAMPAAGRVPWQPTAPEATMAAMEEVAWEVPSSGTETPRNGEAAWAPPAEIAMPDAREAARGRPARESAVPLMRPAPRGLPATSGVRADAEHAVVLARTQFQIQLDYSEQSLETVERILGALYDAAHPRGRLDELLERALGDRYDDYARYLPRGPRPQGLAQEELWQMAKIWGAYVGEVMRECWQGEWSVEEATPGEAMMAIRVRGVAVFPLGMVYDRLANGPDDNVWFFYRALKQRFGVPS